MKGTDGILFEKNYNGMCILHTFKNNDFIFFIFFPLVITKIEKKIIFQKEEEVTTLACTHNTKAGVHIL